MTKRILILSNHFITLYNFRRELIERFLEEGHVVFLSLPDSPENKFFEDMGCRIISTPVDRRGINPIRDLMLLIRYVRTIARTLPHVVYSYTIKPNIYGSIASRCLGVNQVCNITGTGATFLRTGVLSSIATFLYQISIRNASVVFFQNKGDQCLFRRKHMVNRNDALIPGSGVNLKQFPFRMLPLNGEIQFLYTGRIMQLKGIDDLLAAAIELEKRGCIFRVVLAGFIEEEVYSAKLSEPDIPRFVEYLGFQKDIQALIGQSHCCVLPSHGGEGVPNGLLEAAAMGRPVIASSVDGSVEVVEDGVTGYLFESGNEKDLAAKMIAFMSLSPEARSEMGIAGRQKMEQTFDRSIVINHYMRVLKSLTKASIEV